MSVVNASFTTKNHINASKNAITVATTLLPFTVIIVLSVPIDTSIILIKNTFIHKNNNSLINTLELEGENYQALNLMKEAIGYAKEEKYSEIFAFLYYLKFLCEHNLDMDDCERSLDLALIFADHTGIKNIGNLIRKNREIILGS